MCSKEANLAKTPLFAEALHHLQRAHGEDIESLMADARYGLATGLTQRSGQAGS